MLLVLFVLYFIADSARKTTLTMQRGANALRELPFPVGDGFVAAYQRADAWATERGYHRREIVHFSLVSEEDLVRVHGHADPDDTPWWVKSAFWWHPERRCVYSITEVQGRVFHDFDTAFGREPGRPEYELTTSNHPDGAVVPRPPRFPAQVFPGKGADELEALHEQATRWIEARTGLGPLELGDTLAHVRRHLRLQAEHTLAHPLWHLRFYLWHLSKGRRLNRPVWELYEGRIPAPETPDRKDA